MNDISNDAVKKNPYTLWFVVLAFVAPAVLAYLMYFFGDISSFSNHGEILNPVVEIESLQLQDETGEVLPRKALTSKWRMILLSVIPVMMPVMPGCMTVGKYISLLVKINTG